MNNKIAQRKKQILVLLVCLCIISGTFVFYHHYEQKKNQEMLEAMRLAQIAHEKEVQDTADDINARIQALGDVEITLKDSLEIDLLQDQINQANEELAIKITQDRRALRQAQIELETLQARNEQYRHVWGDTFSDSEITTLDTFFEKAPIEVSVYIRMLDDGSTYLFNPLQTYYTASLAKAPYALYLMNQEDLGDISLNSIEREWVTDMISKSDNEATVYLASRYSTVSTSYENFLDSIGFTDPTSSKIISYSYDSGVIEGRMNVIDAGHTMLALYEYFETKTERALALQEDFLSYDYEEPLITIDVPMAKKYGLDSDANHDIAIVYGQRPFIFCILTAGDGRPYMHDPYNLMHEASDLVMSIIEN